MRRFLIGLVGVPVGYLVFAFAGYWAIELFSNNAFDRSLEASMTAVFVIGPGGAIIDLSRDWFWAASPHFSSYPIGLDGLRLVNRWVWVFAF